MKTDPDTVHFPYYIVWKNIMTKTMDATNGHTLLLNIDTATHERWHTDGNKDAKLTWLDPPGKVNTPVPTYGGYRSGCVKAFDGIKAALIPYVVGVDNSSQRKEKKYTVDECKEAFTKAIKEFLETRAEDILKAGRFHTARPQKYDVS